MRANTVAGIGAAMITLRQLRNAEVRLWDQAAWAFILINYSLSIRKFLHADNGSYLIIASLLRE